MTVPIADSVSTLPNLLEACLEKYLHNTYSTDLCVQSEDHDQVETLLARVEFEFTWIPLQMLVECSNLASGLVLS